MYICKVYHPEPPHAQSLFLFPIVFGINSFFRWEEQWDWAEFDHFSWVFDHSSARLAPLERLGESGATHDSQSASRSGVEAWVARNLNGWDDSDAGVTAY